MNASTTSSTLYKHEHEHVPVYAYKLPNNYSYRTTSTNTTETIPVNIQLPLPQSQRGRKAPLPSPSSGSLPQQKYGEHSPERNWLEHSSSPPARQHHRLQPSPPRLRHPSSHRQQPSVHRVYPEYRLPEPPQPSLIHPHGSVEPEQPYLSRMEQQHRLPGPRPPLLQTSMQQRREQQQLSPSQRQTTLVQTVPQPRSVISPTRLGSQNPQEIQQQQSTTTSLPKESVKSLPASSYLVFSEEEQINNRKAIPDEKEVSISSQQEDHKQQSFITAKEADLIDQIREYLQPDVYQYFLKLLNLYSNDIIDTNKLIVNLLPLFEGKIELLEQLQELVGCGVESHNEQPLQITTSIIQKPNLLRCAKVDGSPSYRKVTDLEVCNFY